MDPQYLNSDRIAALLPMQECISVMEEMFRSIAKGGSFQPLRSLAWLKDRSGLLGMMPGFAEEAGMMGIKVISVFPANRDSGLPSHQGVVVLFETRHGKPVLILDAAEITAIRTAAASALATRLLARENAAILSILGSGEQAARHIEAIRLVREINGINCWSRNHRNAEEFSETMAQRYELPVRVFCNAREAVAEADIICTVTSSREPILMGDWIPAGSHINAVGACTPAYRELDTLAIVKSKLYTDCYESLFQEAGDFLTPRAEGAVIDSFVKGNLAELLTGKRKGRENGEEITLFKSLGIALEDLFSAAHIYDKLKQEG